MNNGTILLPLDIYDKHLRSINGVEFTPREMDVISCILNRRGSSIAPFLSIGQRSVETHIRNIRHKAGGLAGREQVIDFIEKSGKASVIKNEYYLGLRLRILFEKKLEEISKCIGNQSLSCFILSGKESQNPPFLIPYLKEHLKSIGCEVKIHLVNEEEPFLSLPPGLENANDGCWLLYILPENIDEVKVERIKATQLPPTIFISLQDIPWGETSQELNLVKIGNNENYYLSFFEILEILFPQHDWEKAIADVKNQMAHIPRKTENVDSADSSHDLLLDTKKPTENVETHNSPIFSWAFLKRRAALCIGIVVPLILFCSYLFMSKGSQELAPLKSYVRSDLVLPHEAVLLQRPEILREIDEKLNGQESIQSIAIIEQGGAGKTTIARQYAHQQKASIVWEINAETSASLSESFENLAQVLSKETEDKKILKELLETKNFREREKRLIEFVKGQLKLQSNWLLIYDNVEEFADIQKYFPQDSHTWGEGKIIITTRNHNIQNNRQVNGFIFMGELSPSQKLNLYTQIMNQGKNHALIVAPNNDLKEFLKQLPPFPLDISVAAYYLKTTNISYAQYLENLRQHDDGFTAIQESLLKEAGEYTKTRYGIISLALNQLISSHKDFGDLLLFISLIDSQNIPKDLLANYKNNIISDDFIYHLKKYSLITSESSIPSIGPTLSIHRSTQAIALTYLTQRLGLERNNPSIGLIGNALTKYLRNAIDTEDFQRKRSLVNHAEAFLSRDNLLTSSLKAVIKGELSFIYYKLSDHKKAKNALEESVSILEHLPEKHEASLFRPLSYLGIVCWGMGELKRPQTLLEQSAKIYKKTNTIDYNGITRALTYLGLVYSDLGHLEKAKDLLEQGLLSYKNSPSKNRSGLGFMLTHLGNVHRSLGNYKKAKTYMEESLALNKKCLSDVRPQTGWALAHLGYLYEDLGYFENAKTLHEQVFEIYKKYYPSTSGYIAIALRNLGIVHTELGNFIKAQSHLEQSLKITTEKYLGKNNIWELRVLFQLGKLYRKMGNLKKSKLILQNCYLAYIEQDGRDFIYTAEVLTELGELYLLENNLKTTEEFLSKALNIYQTKKHPYVYKVSEILAALYLKKSLYAIKKGASQQARNFKVQAINCLKQALEIVKTHFPEDSPHIGRIQGKLERLQQD